jgi:hypothetical protein
VLVSSGVASAVSRRPRRVLLYRDTAGEWRWKAIAGNGKTVADSGEGYEEYRDCFGMVWALFGETVEYDTEGTAP